MSMKINNAFSNYTAATNASKKENKLFNKENATAEALSKKFDKLTISGDGKESYRKSVSESGQSLTYDSMIQQKKILSSGVNYSYNLSKEADKLNKAAEEALTDGKTLSWQNKLDNLGNGHLFPEIHLSCRPSRWSVNRRTQRPRQRGKRTESAGAEGIAQFSGSIWH